MQHRQMITAYQTGERMNQNHCIEESSFLNEDFDDDDEETSIEEQMEYFKTPKFSIDSQVALLPSSGRLQFPSQVLFSFAKNPLANNQQHSTLERPNLDQPEEVEQLGQDFLLELDNPKQCKNNYPHPYAYYNYLSHNDNDRAHSKLPQVRQQQQHSQQRIAPKNASRCLHKTSIIPSEIAIKPDNIIHLASQNIINLNNTMNQRHRLHKRPRTNSSTLSEKENNRLMVPQMQKQQVSNLFVKDNKPVSPIQHRPKVIPQARQVFNDSFSIQAHAIFNDKTNNTCKIQNVQNQNKRMTPPLFLHKQQVLQRKQQQQQQQLLEPLKPICSTLSYQKNTKINSNSGSTVAVIPTAGYDSFDGIRTHCNTQPLEEIIMNQNSFHHHQRELSNRSIKTTSSKPSSAKNSKPPSKLHLPLPPNAQISLFQPLFISNPNSIFAPQHRTNTLS